MHDGTEHTVDVVPDTMRSPVLMIFLTNESWVENVPVSVLRQTGDLCA
jgi:hypothetical protein